MAHGVWLQSVPGLVVPKRTTPSGVIDAKGDGVVEPLQATRRSVAAARIPFMVALYAPLSARLLRRIKMPVEPLAPGRPDFAGSRIGTGAGALEAYRGSITYR